MVIQGKLTDYPHLTALVRIASNMGGVGNLGVNLFMLDSWVTLSKTLVRLTSFVDRVSMLRLSAERLVQSLLNISSGIQVSASLFGLENLTGIIFRR